jgi:hypothetical protein
MEKKRHSKRNLRVTFACAEEIVIEDNTATIFDGEIGQRVTKKRSVPLKEYCGVGIEAQIFVELISRYVNMGGITSCEAFIELYLSCVDKVTTPIDRAMVFKNTLHTIFGFVTDLKERMSEDGLMFPILPSGASVLKISSLGKPYIDHLCAVMMQTIQNTTLIEKYIKYITAVSNVEQLTSVEKYTEHITVVINKDPSTLIQSYIEQITVVSDVEPPNIVDSDGESESSIISVRRTESAFLL